ncbi:MAG: SLC13 family permease [Desulfobacterales bacterium]|nr:SLC13 family permease [Desulfobacterales bacterium]
MSALVVAFGPGVMPATNARALGLTIFTIGFWATGVLPEYLTSLVFFVLAMLFSVSPGYVVFSGFASSVVWLVFGGLLLGVAIKRTGLGERIANQLALKFGKTYGSIIIGMVVVGMALSFLIPATVSRVILLTPIASALAARFGFREGSKGYTGIIMAAVFGTFLPAFSVLPANAPNLVMAGSAETLYGITTIYGEYLWLHFPVLGLLKAVLLIGLILGLYPDTPRLNIPNEVSHTPLSVDEKRLAVILTLTIGFWLTDFWHHISPAWIGLSAGVVCLLPVFRLVPTEGFRHEVNYGTVFFLAGIIGFSAMLRDSGVGDHLAKFLLAVFPLAPDSPVLNYITIIIATFLTGIATTLPAVPAVLTPLAGQMAQAAALPVETVLMIQVIGFSLLLFPYQAPPVVLAIQMGGLKPKAVVHFLILVTIASGLFLLPINFLWWRFIGWI